MRFIMFTSTLLLTPVSAPVTVALAHYQSDSVPVYVEIPAGNGTIAVNHVDSCKAVNETFTPSWFYEVGNLTMNAPDDGALHLAVSNPEHHN